MNKKILFGVGAIFISSLHLPAEKVAIDEKIKAYEITSGVSGKLNSAGSDTLNNLMTLWAEEFKRKYPNIQIQIEGKGSSTAPPALISGTSQLAPMSRKMKNKEAEAFEQKFGYKPTPIRVGIDALAIYANKNNPIKGLTLQQIDSIFSSTYNRRGSNIDNWSKLGVGGKWANRPLSLYGRNSASGTYGFFKKIAMKKGDYKNTVKEQPGSSSVIQGVEKDPFALGYSGIGYKTSGVISIPLAKKDGQFYEANMSNCVSGKYPLARFLYIYVNKIPNKELDRLTKEFIKFVLSKEGQEIIIKDGYYPMPYRVIEKEEMLVN